MALTRPLTLVALLILIVTSYFGLFALARDSGTFSLPTILAYTNRILPNTNTPIALPITNIPAVDNYLAFMAAVFQAPLNPQNINMHLQGTHFLGALMGTWMLMVAEAHRGAGAGFLLLTYILEFIGELIGVGATTPVWCALHLLLTKRGEGLQKARLPENHAWALGYALVLGQGVPTAAMFVTRPDGVGWASQQLWSIIRLGHPLFVLFFWRIFTLLLPSSQSPTTTTTLSHASRAGIRKIYLFSILISATHHILTMSALTAPLWAAGWFDATVLATLDAYTAFMPYPVWTSTAIPQLSFTHGVGNFLKWDETLMLGAVLVWSVALYFESATAAKTSFGTKVNVLLQMLLVAGLAGPAAAPAYLLLEREDLLSLLQFGKTDGEGVRPTGEAKKIGGGRK